MPDPAQLLLAIVASAIVSAGGALLLGGGRTPGPSRCRIACVLAVGIGLVVGYLLLGIRPAWPPTSALGRWLLILFPIVFATELLSAVDRTPKRLAWLLRLALAAAVVRVLLHDSVYLIGAETHWPTWQTLSVCAIGGTLLVVEWALLLRLSQRPAAASIPLALAMASLCGAVAVMVAGYVTGGEAALALAAALVGCAAASGLLNGTACLQGTIGIGVVGLFSLLFIGRFFGGISTATALLVFLAPLACYATELWPRREMRPWLIGAVRLALVGIPLVVVLAGAKRDFELKLRPLMPMRSIQQPLEFAFSQPSNQNVRRGHAE